MSTLLLDLLEASTDRKIIFLGSTRIDDDHDAKDFMARRLKGTVFVPWAELTIENGEISWKGAPLKSFRFVFIGPIGDRASMCSCLRAYLAKHKVPSLFYGTSPELNNKILQTVRLREQGVSQIKTLIGTGEGLTAPQLVKELKLPIVSKIIDGAQGRGIKKHDDEKSLNPVLKSEDLHIYQQFIPNDGDYRVFFIRDQLVYAIKRVRKSEKEFRNNVSLGGSYDFIELPPKALKLAEGARKAMGFDVTGVDLIQHQETGEWYVMEVNSAPQFGGKEMEMVIGQIVKVIQQEARS